MKTRFLLLVGWLWPFIVAGVGIAVIASGHSLRSDNALMLLLIIAIFGSPAIGVSICKWLPDSWPAIGRVSIACLITPLLFVIELILSSWLLEWGARATGYGWIE